MNTNDSSKLLRPIHLPGGRSIPSRILPGPMEGIMTREYCAAMMEFDLVPMWITPFIRISHSTPRPKKLAEKIAHFRPLPVIAQIMGTYREHLARTAGILAGMDGVVGVELNCGCSSNTVIASGAGSALLRKPAWIRDTLLAMRDASNGLGGVGVKIRSGFESPDELPRILEAVYGASPDWITFHYRTGREFFRKIPDGYHRFKTAREILPDAFIFASGDLFMPESSIKVVSDFKMDGITPARGLMHNPWLIRDIESACRVGDGPPVRDIIPFLKRLMEISALRPRWKNGVILEIARNAWGRNSEKFLALAKTKTPEEMRKALMIGDDR